MTLSQKTLKALHTIEYALLHYERPIVTTSFGKDSMVLTNLVRQIETDVSFVDVVLNTDFDETKRFVADTRHLWRLNCDIYFRKQETDISLDLCCVEAIKEALDGATSNRDAIISGLRQDKIEEQVDYVKRVGAVALVNPISEFSETDIWKYIAIHSIPINPLYSRGYRSLCCQRCSMVETNEFEPEISIMSKRRKTKFTNPVERYQ